MRASVPLLVLALLAAGCATAPEDAPATTSPTPGEPLPWPIPEEEKLGADACGEMTLTATPARARPGEEVVFQGVFRNCGDKPMRYEHTCGSLPPWNPRTSLDGRTYSLGERGAAFVVEACPANLGSWRVGAGETMERTWWWNVTLQDCADCAYHDAPPGAYAFRSVLTKEAATPWDDLDGWNATATVEALPRPSAG